MNHHHCFLQTPKRNTLGSTLLPSTPSAPRPTYLFTAFDNEDIMRGLQFPNLSEKIESKEKQRPILRRRSENGFSELLDNERANLRID
mmetsp:Transcript_9893/g.14818  ORF Transcript_9893/g.14818 Transcript_9893/m.14818 type:complete len:88 (+) Transcript_9893:89-352(+)